MPNITLQGDSQVEAVDYTIKSRERIAKILHLNLQKSHNRMKLYADRKRIYKEFLVGDLVYLKIQPYKQMILANTPFHKLATRYCGPFSILERTGTVANKLELPIGTKIHAVFHLSLLKKTSR